jgi:hypothetical protein
MFLWFNQPLEKQKLKIFLAKPQLSAVTSYLWKIGTLVALQVECTTRRRFSER